jgi:hypothetical protein
MTCDILYKLISHFADEETKIQKDSVTFLRPHSLDHRQLFRLLTLGAWPARRTPSLMLPGY